MAGSHTITVRRQVVDAEVRGSEQDGLVVQRYLSGSAERVVAGALEQALDGLAPTEDHLVVDRLEIELVDVPLDGLDEALAEAVRRDAAAFFQRHTPPRADGAAATRAADGPVQRRTGAATAAEAFVLFLRTGRVPWSFTGADGSDLETAVRSAGGWRGRDEPDAPIWERVRQALDRREARLRVVKQFSPTFVHWLVRRLAPDTAHAMTAVLAPAGDDEKTRSAFDRQVRLAALAAVAGRRPTTSRALAARALAGMPAAARADRLLVQHLGGRWPGVVPDTSVPGVPADEGSTHTARRTTGEVTPAVDLAALTDEEADASTSFPVDHAGLVLLHPFLPRFLEGLGVAAGDRLVDVDRAVALLHHLATGAPEVPEQETTLAKILCGCPLEEPVEREPGLTGDEIAEAAALLTAVIGHWDALRSTSPDALRAEFLTRPGLLSVDDGGDWLLRVEQRSVDILLEQLPWGISMVRTPWMRRMLRVEWRV